MDGWEINRNTEKRSTQFKLGRLNPYLNFFFKKNPISH